MTTPHDPGAPVPDASELDELASALVDGEATADEQARTSEPEVAARVAELEAVARLVATPVEPVDDVARARAIRAALAAAEPAPGRVRRMPQWLAPAAAVVVVLAGFGLFLAAIAGSGSDGDETADAGAGTEATALAEDAFEGAGGGETSAEAPMAGSTAAGLVELGTFDDVGALVVAVRGVAPPEGEAADGADDDSVVAERSAQLEGVGCGAAFASVPVEQVAGATLDGVHVLVAVLRQPDGRRTYTVVRDDTCEVVATGDL